MCYDTHCTVHNMIIDIWIINKNFLQPFHILMRREELQICLNITDTSSLNQVSNHHCQPFTKLLDILQRSYAGTTICSFKTACMYVCILRAGVQPILDPYAEAFL